MTRLVLIEKKRTEQQGIHAQTTGVPKQEIETTDMAAQLDNNTGGC